MQESLSLMSAETLSGLIRMATERISMQQFAEAERLLWTVLQTNPRQHAALHLMAQLACQFGKYEAGAELAEQALAVSGDNAAYHVTRGRAYRGLGQMLQAEVSFRRALVLQPDFQDAHVLLGLTLKSLGKLDEAAQLYRRALDLQPEHAVAKINLANVLRVQGQAAASARYYRDAAAQAPHLAAAQSALAASFVVQGRRDEALEQYQRALALDPDQPNAHFMVGSIQRERGGNHEAIEAFRRAVEQQPRFAAAWVNLGLALREAGYAPEALRAYRTAIAAEPENIEAHINLGSALAEFGAREESLVLLRRAAQLRPDDSSVLNNLGAVLLLNSRPAEAEAVLRRAVYLQPEKSQLRNSLGLALQGAGKQHESLAQLREAVRLDPENLQAHNNLLLSLNYADEVAPEEIVDAARQFGLHVPTRAFAGAGACGAADHQRLRVGYLSPDLRQHSVAHFIEPVLANHDRTTLDIRLYHLHPAEDEVSARLRAYCDGWANCFAQPDSAIARRIHDDRIDILVDLAGHTGHARLPVFAYRPAPVQITWLGFPTTVGLPDIDWRLSDWLVDPPGYERFNTETLLRLPTSYFCYRPASVPDPGPLPALEKGFVTFGSFNNLAKLSDATVALWARVLAALPGARLILKAEALDETETWERVAHAFVAAGVAPGAVARFSWAADSAAHLKLYSHVDIALDTYPYNGATTTCEALWMGVPVVSMSGTIHAARMGRSILTAAGLDRLVAENPDQFVQIALSLAAQLPALAHLRSHLRQDLRDSPLMDEAGFTRSLEALYRQAWRHATAA